MANQKFCGAVASQAYRWGYICEYCKQPVEKKNVPAPQAANTAPARLAALPWNADDLPRFDEDFLAAQKARWQQAKDMGIMP